MNNHGIQNLIKKEKDIVNIKIMIKKYVILNINNLYLTNKNEWLKDITFSKKFDSIDDIDDFINKNKELIKNNNILETKTIFIRK